MKNQPVTDGTQWERLAAQLHVQRGHFEYESGHHGDLSYDLELMFRNPKAVQPLSLALANRLAPYEPEIICGPLVEGAFIAIQVASELGLEFTYAERQVIPEATGLYPVLYSIPGELRRIVSGRRVAIVNDVINAGSAVLGTLTDLRKCSAVPVALGTLLLLGEKAGTIADAAALPLEALATQPNTLYQPEDCPMCRDGTPLIPHSGS